MLWNNNVGQKKKRLEVTWDFYFFNARYGQVEYNLANEGNTPLLQPETHGVWMLDVVRLLARWSLRSQ